MSSVAQPRLKKVVYMRKIAFRADIDYDTNTPGSPRRFRLEELRDILEALAGEWPYQEVGLHPTQRDIMHAIADRAGFPFDGENPDLRAFEKHEVRAIYRALREADDGG